VDGGYLYEGAIPDVLFTPGVDRKATSKGMQQQVRTRRQLMELAYARRADARIKASSPAWSPNRPESMGSPEGEGWVRHRQ
jgi:hypothetical protein